MQDYNDERDLQTLLALLKEKNPNLPSFEKIKNDTEYIFYCFQQEMLRYKTDSNYICSIQNKFRNNDAKGIIISMMLINYCFFGYIPRKIQIISLLLMINNPMRNGLIEEVKTGEGKSTIIMFLATLKALEGKKVDILTSSPVLAERDSKRNKQFYAFFGLTCDYCHEDENNTNQTLTYQNYYSDIVYGSMLSFAGDYLRTSFVGSKGRGNRKFEVIIIDEIDNICLDNIMNQTELVDNFKGYKFLEYFYLIIYYYLQQICFKECRSSGRNALLNNKATIVEKLLDKFNEFYSQNSSTKAIKFPPHLETFIQNRKKDWCNCAYDAFLIYKENKHYLISYDEEYKFETIKPIDFSNTGIIQDNSVWSGLHQFLEIKHGLRLTEENLNSCFISNLCFFRLYKEKFGLTGTIGSKKTQEVLKNIYDLDVIFIPTFKEGKYLFNSQSDYSCDNNQQKFYENVLMEIIQKYYANRAILVIVKYIDQVKIIKKKLEESNQIDTRNIIVYDRNDNPEQSNFLNKEIGPKTIILSTNLCGRGTDIKINKECERNGGLYVILTFNAESERIEKQALGRAARKGENGSGKIMLFGNVSYENLKNKRESKENTKFEYLMNSFKKRTIFFQDLFERFCFELNKMKTRNVSIGQIIDIKEKWGLFLVENDLDKLEEQEDLQQFNSYNSNMGQNIANIKVEIIKNGADRNYQIINQKFIKFINDTFYNNKAYEYINPFIIISDFEDKSFEKAQKMCDSLSLGANYMQIYKKITGFTKRIDLASFQEILHSFYNLKNKVESLIKQYKLCEQLIESIQFFGKRKELFKQNKEKIKYLEDFKQNLEDNISFINIYAMKKRHIHPGDIEIKLGQIKCKKEDIIKYFQDLGLYYIFNIQLNESCNIF